MVALLIVTAACSGDSPEATQPPLAEVSSSITTASPTTAAATTTTAALTAGVRIGTEVKTALGNTVTVYSFDPAVSTRLTASAGRTFTAIDVGGCVVGSSAPADGPGPAFFQLVMPDDTRASPASPVKEPALRVTRLAPGECIRGWVTFESPAGVRPVAVVFNASTLIRWTL